MFTPSDVNLNRVLAEISALAVFGKTAEGGITRPALSEAHITATHTVANWMFEAGLTPYFDRWGNLYGRTTKDASTPCVLTGSHLDSVLNGGNYDGPLGVLSSLEAVRLIREKSAAVTKPIEIVAFVEEEGSRFRGLLGSSLATGQLADTEIEAIIDFDGNRFLDVLSQTRFAFPIDLKGDLTKRVDAYIELHIEQDVRLERARKSIGIVTSIAGARFWRVDYVGQADHAGATAYENRRDALLAASELVVSVRDIGVRVFNDSARMTVGKIENSPNVTNIVPGKVTLYIDNRTSDHTAHTAVETAITALISEIAQKHRVDYQIEKLLDIPAEITPAHVLNAIRQGCIQAGVEHESLVSWAAHDAMNLARVCNAGMIFVPCREGRSHSPAEYVKPEDIAAGIAVLANTLAYLAN